MNKIKKQRNKYRKFLKIIRDFPPKGYSRRTEDGYPAEIVYDEYAYKRIINSYRKLAKKGLKNDV